MCNPIRICSQEKVDVTYEVKFNVILEKGLGEFPLEGIRRPEGKLSTYSPT